MAAGDQHDARHQETHGAKQEPNCRMVETAKKDFECQPEKSSGVSRELPSKRQNPNMWHDIEDK